MVLLLPMQVKMIHNSGKLVKIQCIVGASLNINVSRTNACVKKYMHMTMASYSYHTQNKIEHHCEKYDDILFRTSSGTDGHLIPKNTTPC